MVLALGFCLWVVAAVEQPCLPAGCLTILRSQVPCALVGLHLLAVPRNWSQQSVVLHMHERVVIAVQGKFQAAFLCVQVGHALL